MNKWIGRIKSQTWNVAIFVLHNFFGFVINTTAYHLGWNILHLLLLTSSMYNSINTYFAVNCQAISYDQNQFCITWHRPSCRTFTQSLRKRVASSGWDTNPIPSRTSSSGPLSSCRETFLLFAPLKMAGSWSWSLMATTSRRISETSGLCSVTSSMDILSQTTQRDGIHRAEILKIFTYIKTNTESIGIYRLLICCLL